MRRYDWEGGLVEDLSNELEDVEDCFDASKEHDGGKKQRVYLGGRGDAGGYLCTCVQSQPLGRLVVWLVEIEIIQPSKRVGGNTTRTRRGARLTERSRAWAAARAGDCSLVYVPLGMLDLPNIWNYNCRL